MVELDYMTMTFRDVIVSLNSCLTGVLYVINEDSLKMISQIKILPHKA